MTPVKTIVALSGAATLLSAAGTARAADLPVRCGNIAAQPHHRSGREKAERRRGGEVGG